MKTRNAIALAVLAGLGGIGVGQTLRAQTTPPVYYIAELDPTNPEVAKEFAAKVEQSIKASGGRYLVRRPTITALEGPPPPTGMVITAWNNLDQLKAWFNGPYKDMHELRDKAHKFIRAYAVTGYAN